MGKKRMVETQSTDAADDRANAPHLARRGDASCLALVCRQLLVRGESSCIRVNAQERREQFSLPGLPRLGVVPRRSRALQRAPQPLPRFSALVDPQRGVAAGAGALDALEEMMGHEAGKAEQAAG